MLTRMCPKLGQLRVVLGSASPRRAQICGQMGLRVVVIETGFPEDLGWRNFERPEEYVMATARGKEAAFLAAGHQFDLVILADTIISCEGKVYEKPDSKEDARRIITELQGKEHTVKTAVIVTARNGETLKSWSSIGSSTVQMRAMTPEIVEAYLDTEEYVGLCGGYGFQAPSGPVLIEKINGCYFNVLGLPTTLLIELLNSALEFLP